MPFGKGMRYRCARAGSVAIQETWVVLNHSTRISADPGVNIVDHSVLPPGWVMLSTVKELE